MNRKQRDSNRMTTFKLTIQVEIRNLLYANMPISNSDDGHEFAGKLIHQAISKFVPSETDYSINADTAGVISIEYKDWQK